MVNPTVPPVSPALRQIRRKFRQIQFPNHTGFEERTQQLLFVFPAVRGDEIRGRFEFL